MTYPTGILCNRAKEVATLLKLMANEQRLILLCRLRDGEASVGELVGLCNLSQSSVSQHLARLRDSGLVDTRREQTTIYYSIASEDVRHLLNYLCDRFWEK
ncbi:MAG: ArsR family transcriptional regulator [Sphingobium sp.]|nr:ArsR family transcriptional regulator [Sphingobium sp.]